MSIEVSDTWRELQHMRNTRKEYRFTVNGVVYGSEAEVSHSVDSGLFEEFSAGNASCAQLSLTLYTSDEIPRGAKITREVRLENEGRTSEWIPAGTFYINRRQKDDDYWTIEAFDLMRKAEQSWTPSQEIQFPLAMPEAVNQLCTVLGCELDPRTELNPDYTIDYPSSDPDSESGDYYTVRQILQWIAAAHGGNFIITPDEKLRLVLLARIDQPEEEDDRDSHEVGQDYVNFTDNGKTKPVSRVTLVLDDENVITAGDDTGLELSMSCPYATQPMADAILAQLSGYQYQMYEASAVNIDPAAELGDLVEVNGICSSIDRISDDGLGYPDISAPGKEELEDEYPSTSYVETSFNRKLAQTRSAIEKSAEEIREYVQNDVTNALAEVDVSLEAITQRITDGENKTAEIEAKVDGIKMEVTTDAGADGSVYARITLKIGQNSYSGYIKMEGNVDVSGQLSADALYAALGDIAQLTVDRVSTSRRIPLYLAKDRGNDNYIRIRDNEIEFVTGVNAGGTEQAVSPTGMPLYWESNPDGASLGADGYPYRDGERIFTTTAQTNWPVTVYTYIESVSRKICFDNAAGSYAPIDLFGAGDGNGGNIGQIVKSTTGFEFTYKTTAKKEIGMKAGNSGYLDLYGLRKTTALDFSDWDSGSFTETLDGDNVLRYQVESDEGGRPVRIIDGDGHVTEITW